MPAKHSQYFLRHLLFLQWQPLVCAATLGEVPTPGPLTLDEAAILGLNAWLRLRSSVAPIALVRCGSLSGVLAQSAQLQFEQ